MNPLRKAFFLMLLWPVCGLAGDDYRAADHVINGKSLVLAGGDIVRLASIEAPNLQEENTSARPGRPGEPMGAEAKAALERLALGKELRVATTVEGRDRHGRIVGQVYTREGVWLQGEMLKQGYAMVYSFSDDDPAIIRKMLAFEREARAQKLGIWAHPYFRVATPGETNDFINRFKIVEGRVVSVNDYKGHTYINFNEHWKGNFAVFISRKFAKAFETMNLKSLAGKTVRVRGWIHYHNAPMVDVTHPEEIETE